MQVALLRLAVYTHELWTTFWRTACLAQTAQAFWELDTYTLDDTKYEQRYSSKIMPNTLFKSSQTMSAHTEPDCLETSSEGFVNETNAQGFSFCFYSESQVSFG